MKCDKCNYKVDNIGNLTRHKLVCDKVHIDDVLSDYNELSLSITEISAKYNVGKSFMNSFFKRNNIELRDTKEQIKLTHKKYKRVTSDETKTKLREIRIKWMKDNPEKTAWRLSNMSYPEKIFNEYIIKNQLDKKYLIVREKSFYPYFIDFAFENEKIAFEIDGSQHNKKERKEKDIKKDRLLNENGWKVIRISAKSLIENINILDDIFENLESIDDNKKVGIFDYTLIVDERKKKREEKCLILDRSRITYDGKIRTEFDSFTKEEISGKLIQRKVDRPSYEELIKEIEELGYKGTGRKYGVADNTIRKWKKMCEKYGKNWNK